MLSGVDLESPDVVSVTVRVAVLRPRCEGPAVMLNEVVTVGLTVRDPPAVKANVLASGPVMAPDNVRTVLPLFVTTLPSPPRLE